MTVSVVDDMNESIFLGVLLASSMERDLAEIRNFVEDADGVLLANWLFRRAAVVDASSFWPFIFWLSSTLP